MRNLTKSAGLTLLVLVICLSGVSAQKIDCRKYVFAPKCRGISAKRGLDPRAYPSDPTFKTHSEEEPLDYLMMEDTEPSDTFSLTEAERPEDRSFSHARHQEYRPTSPLLQNRILRALIRALVERNSGEWEV